MIATSSPSFVGLSPSSVLSESLGSKLRKQLDSTGWMEYRQTWKRMATRSGRLYWAHTASAHRTSGNVCSGWPTPTVDDANNVTRASGQFQSLPRTAQLAGWVTPNSRDWKDSPGMATEGINPDGSKRTRLDMLPRQAHLCGWATPTAQDGTRGGLPPRAHDTGIPLSQQVSGIITQSSTAGTEKPAALNPDHSRWLMGFPAAWGSCGATAMQSSRRQRRCLSEPLSKSNNNKHPPQRQPE